jgi:hypothetical protein
MFEPGRPRLASVVLVTLHFLARRYLTEHKGTPHLGHKADSRTKTKETALGIIGDFLLAGIMTYVWRLTSHALWLAAALTIIFSYMLGVLVQRFLDPETRQASSYPFVLNAHMLVAFLICVFYLFETVNPLNLYAIFSAGAIVLAVVTKLGRLLSLGMTVTSIVFVLALIVGATTANRFLLTRALFATDPTPTQLMRFVIFVVFLSTLSSQFFTLGIRFADTTTN